MAKLFSGGNSTVAKGYYVDKGNIISIENNPNSQKEMDYIIKVETENDNGKKFHTNIYLNGNLFKNGSIPPNLTFFLEAIGIPNHPNAEELIDDFSIGKLNPSLLAKAIGKEIHFLKYVSGTYQATDGSIKPSYKVWNGRQSGFSNLVNVWSMSTPVTEIYKAFEKELKSDYPPKFTPDVLESNNNQSESKQSGKPNNDLPF